MKRMVVVGIMAVLACALFLVPYASAACKVTILDTWVENPSGEVLDEYTYGDVKEDYTYNVKLGIEGTSMRPIFVKAHLTFGPNYRNRNCKEYRTKKGKIDLGETTTTISFADLSFLPLADCDEAFKEFTDGKSGWKWDKCWYKFDVESTMVEGAQTEIKRGIPIVTICKEIFKNPYVNQNETYKDLSFDYSVVVWSNKNDSVKLLVRDKNGRWSSMGSRNYTSPYSWQPLIWHGVNLSLDNFTRNFEGNLEGRYRFVGSCNESPPSGHVGPVIEEEFYDPMVSYNETVNELSFDYEVTACCKVEDNNILLEVWNFSANSWEPKVIRSYTKPGYNQTLRWAGINLSYDDHFDDHLRGKYRFTGTYGESSPTDKGHQRPIIEESFYNFNVTPPDGTINDTFTYNVTVTANISDKIVLQVLNYTSGNWTSKGTKSYTRPGTPDTLVWPNIKLNIYELNPLNDARYRFVGFCNRSKSEEKESPFWETGLEWYDISVKPERDLWNAEFNYCIRMRAERNLSVKLGVYKPSDKEWPSKEEIYNDTEDYTNITNWTTICWNIKPFIEAFQKENCVGDAGYKFIFYRKGEFINETDISRGPSVNIAKFSNAMVEPKNGTREKTFTYTVIVNATETGEVRIYWEDAAQEHSDDKSIGQYNTPNKEVRHTCSMTFEQCELGNITYWFKFESSKDTYSEKFAGPLLTEEKFSDFSVNPDEGNYTTCFNFTANLISRKLGNVPVTLQVSLDEAADDADWEDVATKRYENDIPESQIPINSMVCMDENEVTKNLASAWVNNKVIFWRVKGLVNESITIPTRYNVSLKWYNSSVSPEEGWWYDSFSFRVSLSAIENGTVALQVKLNESDSDWQNRGKAYNYSRPDPESYTWLKETLCDDSFAGNTWYRFEFNCSGVPYYSNESGLGGPKLFIPLNISFTDDCVEDMEDVIFNKTFGGLFNETSNTFFNFSINVTANDTTAVDLIVVDSDNNHHPERDYKIYDTEPPQRLRFTWTRKELPLAEIGNWNYTFRYNDSRYGTMPYNKSFEGPRIIAVFNDYEIDPYPILFNRKHNVTVWMTATIPMEIELESFNLYQNKRIWEPVGTRDYEPPGEQPLNWTINTFDIPFNNLRLNWKRKGNGE